MRNSPAAQIRNNPAENWSCYPSSLASGEAVHLLPDYAGGAQAPEVIAPHLPAASAPASRESPARRKVSPAKA